MTKKPKVLFIGVYRDGTGWGQAAINHILALDSVGVNVVPRYVSLGNTSPQPVPARINALEQQDLDGCTHCIQCVLPQFSVYNKKVGKNIGMYNTETRNLGERRWVDCMNMMDEIWVHNPESKECLLNGDLHGKSVTKPIRIHPHPTKTDVNLTEKLNLPGGSNSFRFYYIGDMIRRKGIKQLLEAFHSEFRYNEPVSLIMKIGSGALHEFEELSKHVKNSLGIYSDTNNYRQELVIAEHLPEKNLEYLHNACDCFVIPSHGEAWSIPAADAICHHKPVICTDAVGIHSYISEAAYVIESMPEYQCLDDSRLLDPYIGDEMWSSINVTELRRVMRMAYENKVLYKEKCDKCEVLKQQFSYTSVGNLLKESLNG